MEGGYLFKGTPTKSRKAMLSEVAAIIGDGKCIVRDGTKPETLDFQSEKDCLRVEDATVSRRVPPASVMHKSRESSKPDSASVKFAKLKNKQSSSANNSSGNGSPCPNSPVYVL